MVEIKVGNAAGMSSLRFLNHTYNVYVSENSPRGTLVTTTTAAFKDSRNSGRISYSFASGNEEDTFSINSNTGKLEEFCFLNFITEFYWFSIKKFVLKIK